MVLFAAPILFNAEVRARFDIVGFDPRGVIRSSALRCFGNDKQWAPFFTPFAFPITDAEEAIWQSADRFLTGECDQRGGRIASHISTANVARDLDSLRKAVGDDKLTYVGYSYGTAIGVQYANLFPAKVRALVVDGVLDPVEWTTGSGNGTTVPMTNRLGSHLGSQATLEEFFRLCDAGTCAFGPGSATRFGAPAELRELPRVLPRGCLRRQRQPELVRGVLRCGGQRNGLLRAALGMDGEHLRGLERT